VLIGMVGTDETGGRLADYAAARDRFDAPPLLEPRSALWVAPPDQVNALDALLAEVDTLQPVAVDAALERCAALRPDRLAAAALEPDAATIDVLALHQAYARGLVVAGGTIRRSWPVATLARSGSGWRVSGPASEVLAGVVVLAAGAWCDELAARAGAGPIGLRPLRRTLAVCRVPSSARLDADGPLVSDAAHSWYFKPEGPNVLVSPADETPSEPCDAQADEADVALGIERVNEATTLALRSVVTAWAGLRTFAQDRVPVVGEDPRCPGLFWLAGQGGYGIQTAPAMARSLAGLVTGAGLPADVASRGVTEAALSPTRFFR
jgi:D-arginine dehydrogenase